MASNNAIQPNVKPIGSTLTQTTAQFNCSDLVCSSSWWFFRESMAFMCLLWGRDWDIGIAIGIATILNRKARSHSQMSLAKSSLKVVAKNNFIIVIHPLWLAIHLARKIVSMGLPVQATWILPRMQLSLARQELQDFLSLFLSLSLFSKLQQMLECALWWSLVASNGFELCANNKSRCLLSN